MYTNDDIGVSVIIPVYNCESYLERCLQSLCEQKMQNIEFIVIDDGSTDRSSEIIDDFAKRDPRFVAIHKENGGVASARNMALDIARGEYLGFVDSDDYVEPGCFDILLSHAKAKASDLVICDYYTDYRNIKIPFTLRLSDEIFDLTEIGHERFYLCWLAKEITLWNHLFRRSIVEDHTIRFETNRGEDNLFHLRMLPYLRRVSFLKQSLYHYVQRENSLTHISRFDVKKRQTNLLECYLKRPITTEERKTFSPLMPDYILANLFTGLIFSHAIPGVPISFFREQLKQMRKSSDFSGFCRRLATTNKLEDLYRFGAMSVRFYQAEQIVFFCCHVGQDWLASWMMWVLSRMVAFKRLLRPGILQ